MAITKSRVRQIVRDVWQRRAEQTEVRTFDGHTVTLADVHAGAARYVTNAQGEQELREWKRSKPRKSRRPKCGAKCRNGEPCKARVCLKPSGKLARRCRMHGGLSTGPKSLRPCPKDNPEARARMLVAIRTGATVKAIAKAGGVTPNTFYLWQERDPEFKAQVGQAYCGHPRTSYADAFAGLPGLPASLRAKLERMRQEAATPV